MLDHVSHPRIELESDLYSLGCRIDQDLMHTGLIPS